MKRTFLFLIVMGWMLNPFALVKGAEEEKPAVKFEFATIRWGGRDNTCIIRPNGKAEFIGSKLYRIAKPERVDERTFYLSLTMNALGKEGYDFAGAVNNDEIIMKRQSTGSAKESLE
jgi:hypothetical protein